MALLRMRFSLHCLPCVLIKLVNMVIKCCSQEHSYSNFYGLVSERFCKLNQECNECHESFETYFETIRHMKRIFCVISHGYHMAITWIFGHLANDAISSWAILQAIKMNEDDNTSSSHIFVKIMKQEDTESMGL